MSEAEAGKGEAPPEGESQEGKGEFKPPKDGSWLPRERVKEMIASAVSRAKDEFSAKIEEIKAQGQAKAEPAREYTKAQLSEFVEAGKLSQDAADQLWENQIVERATRKAVDAATSAVASGNLQRTISQQMAEFKALIPDAWEEGTPEREKVAKAYRSLLTDGIKGSSEQLELQALKQAFGDPADIRRARSFGKNGPQDSFEDSGGGGNRHRQGEDDGADGPPKGLDSRQRAHYEKGIASGRYKDWSEVRAELKFARQQKRA